MALFPRSEEDKKRRAAERKRKFEERKAAMEKKQREVREGRAAGLSMTEIRAKRMNISADELKKRQLATFLGMAEGMSMFLPAGAAIKAGQLVYKGLKGAKAAKALKAAATAKKTGKSVKPVSAVKVPARPTSGPATRGGRRGGKKNDVIEGTAVEKSSKPVRTTKPSDKKPGTAVATRPRTDVKKPGTGVMEIRQAPKPPRGMKRANATDKPTPKPAVRGPAKPKKKLTARQKALLAGTAGAVAGGAAFLAGDKDKATAGGTGGTGKKRASPGGTNKGKDPKKTAPRTSGPSTRGSNRPPSADKAPARKPSGPQTRGSQKRGATAPITAGKNTGFGPKGNIFPSSAAERAALMKMYGGTGSAAAKAAAAGKQGDMTAGKAALEKAKKDRLKRKK